MSTLTYGDTFTLPSAPGVLWLIEDRRSHTEPTDTTRAYAVPCHEDGTKYAYDEPVKIGRAERVGLFIKLITHRAPYLAGRAWEQRPTAAQEEAVDGALSPLSFDQPALTDAEISGRIVARAADGNAYSAAREAVNGLSIPKGYSSTDQDYQAVQRALHADPATVPAIRAALIAAFTAEIEKWSL